MIADPRGFQRGFAQANRSADTFSRGIKRTAGLIGGAFAGIQVAGFLKDAINEAREAAKVTRQTNAVIKSTGGVANVSAKDVDRLATALMRKVGVDDDVIAAGQNMLLTFKGVRNEVGKGNDIFNQTTKVALDMTAALNQGEISQSGLEQTTMRLGKALNDPIKGISALTRVGVTFDQATKDQIKTLVEQGKTMEAQKIILKELGTEFGGAAEAAADPWSRLTVAFGEVQEAIGTVLLPAFNSVAEFITGTFIPAVEKWWKEHGPKVREAFRKLGEVLGDVWATIRDDLLPAFQEVATFVDTDLQPTIDDLTQTWKDNKDAIGGLKQTNDVSMDSWKRVAGFLANVMAKQVERLTSVVGVLARVWTASSRVVNVATTKMVVTFLSANRTMIRGAATVAEALHLPMAKGLRKAEQRMGAWVKDFNKNLNQLDDEGVNIKLRSTFTPPKGFSMHSIVGQKGLRLPGYGGGDIVPAMLEPGEAVVPKEAARESGFISWAGAKGIPGFRFGGVVPRAESFSTAGMRGTQEGIDAKVARRVAAGIARNKKLLLGFGPSSTWPGGDRGGGGTVGAAANAWRVFGRLFGVPMLGVGSRPNPSDHPFGKAIDVMTGNRAMHEAIKAVGMQLPGAKYWISFRQIGHARDGFSPRSYGGPNPHTDHVHWSFYDKGGMLPPGLSLAYNGTGRPERVLPPGGGSGIDYDRLAKAIVTALGSRPIRATMDPAYARQALKDSQRREGVPRREQVR